MDLYGTREANRFPRQSLDTCTERQVVTLYTLCKNFSCEVSLLRDFPGITAPVVACYHPDVEGGQQRQQLPACFIVSWPEGVGQYATRFSVVRVPEPVLSRLTANETPLLIEFTDEGNISVSDRRRGYS